MNARFLLLLTACVAIAAAQTTEVEQRALIAKIKAAGIADTQQLKSFIGSQRRVRSTASVQKSNKWKQLDIQESDFYFDAGDLKYKLLRVNGDAKNPQKKIKKGYFDAWGEFTAVEWVFDSKRHAEFSWDRVDSSGACVIRYSVPQAASNLGIVANTESVILGHSGFVFANCSTGVISRIQIHTDPGTIRFYGRNVVTGMDVDITYAVAMVGGQEFLLPSQGVLIAQFHTALTKSELTFTDYRKYEASSSIQFDIP